MAKPTQLTVSGAAASGSNGLSDSLFKLSKNLLDQGDAEEERKRAAAADLENKRRFQLGIERQDARYGVEDKRYEADQIRQSIAEVEAKRRWEAEAAMRQATHKAQMDEIDRVKAERDALKYIDRSAANGDFREHKFQIGDQPTELQGVFNSVLGRLEGTKSELRNVLTPGTEGWSAENGDYATLMANYSTLMKNSALSDDKKNENIDAFGKDILGLMHEKTVNTGNLSSEEWQKKADDIVNRRFDPLIKNVNDGINEGQGLDRDSALAAIIRTLPDNVRDNILYSDLDKLLGNRFDFSTKEQIRATEQARVDNLNAAEKVIYDRNLDKLKLIKDAGTSSGSGGNKTAKGMLNTFKALNVEGTTEDGIGSWDMDDVNKGVNYLIDKYKDEGLDPDAIAAVFIGGVESKWLGLDDDFPEVGTEAFGKLEQRVIDLSGKYSGGGSTSFNKALKDSESLFGYKPETARSLLDVQRDSIKIRGDNNYRLGVDPKYDFVAKEAKAKAAAKAAKAEEDAKAAAAKAAAATPNPALTTVQAGSIVPKDVLSPETLKVLDTAPNRTVDTRGRSTTPLTEQNKLSRDILDAIEVLNRKDASLNNPHIGARQKRYLSKDREKAAALVKELEARLLSLSK